MPTKARRQAIVLGGLVVALVAILWWNLSSGLAPPSAGPAPAGSAATRLARGTPQQVSAAALEVELADLKQPRPDPADGHRNPFRFEATAPPPPVRPPGGPPPMPPGLTGPDGRPMPGGAPAGPAPPPPIALKFIGIVEETGHRRLAALSDGRFTYYGREGDIIEGRYRIVRIGLESIEMVHVDGRGPQTIRLSGS
jgi:hypothetical protein